MSHFTVTVELKDANAAHLATLSEVMQREGFTTTIAAFNGSEFRLPHAVFNYTIEDYSGATLQQIADKAREAANRVGQNRILVTRSAGRHWIDLDEA